MKVRERERPGTLADFFVSLLGAMNYRIPMKIREIVIFPSYLGETGCYRCPRCAITLERDYQSFCDRCGQRLNWDDCEQAAPVYPAERK